MDGERENLNIQNDVFNRARKDRAKVMLFLVNGKKLVGRIKAFDRFTLLLDSGHGEQVIFKHAIATVSPARSFENRMEVPRREGGGARPSAPRGGETGS